MFLEGVKGRYWAQISHRKLNISIWVGSDSVEPPKDPLLRRGGKGYCNIVSKELQRIMKDEKGREGVKNITYFEMTSFMVGPLVLALIAHH